MTPAQCTATPLPGIGTLRLPARLEPVPYRRGRRSGDAVAGWSWRERGWPRPGRGWGDCRAALDVSVHPLPARNLEPVEWLARRTRYAPHAREGVPPDRLIAERRGRRVVSRAFFHAGRVLLVRTAHGSGRVYPWEAVFDDLLNRPLVEEIGT